MPYNGSGGFTRTMNWQADASAGTKIRADRHDQEDDNFASGLSNAICKDGQSQVTADIPFNGRRITNLGAPVNDADAANKAYADLPKPFTTGATISGADANGRLSLSSPTGANGLAFVGADLSWLARLATAAGPGTPPVPPATLNRMVLNDKPDGTGTDVATINDTGAMTITGSFTASGNIIGTPTVAAKAAAGNVNLWLYGPDNEDRGVIYTNAAAQGSVFLRVGGTQSFDFNTSGQFKAPGALYAGPALYNTDGNITGAVWLNLGYNDAYSAIVNRIESRAAAHANSAVSQLQYRKVSQGSIGTTSVGAHIAPAGAVLSGLQGGSSTISAMYYMYLQVYDPVRGWVGFSGMNITDYGFFTVIEPPPGNVVLLFVNDDGQDWYDIRKDLTEWDEKGVFISAILPTWAMVDQDGVVTNVEYDPSRLMPGDRRVLGIDAPIEEIKTGMIYRDGELHEHDPA